MGGLGTGLKALVALGAMVMVGREVHMLWLQAQPPLAAEGEAAVFDELLAAGPLDLELYISPKSSLSYPPPEKHVIRLATFSSAQPSWQQSMEDAKINVTIPAPMRKRKDMDLHLFVFAVKSFWNGSADVKRIVRSHSTVISRNVTLQNQKYPTRKLLEDASPAPLQDGEVRVVEPVTGLPRAVEVGFVVEERALSLAAIKNSDSILRGYLMNQGGSKSTLQLPLFCNTLISPRDEYADVSENFEMEIHFRNIGLAVFSLQRILLASFDDAEQMMKINAYDLDSFKQLITGSAPWKFAVVYGVAILHLIFGYLALSADLSYWRGREGFEGMSSRSIFLACVSNCISFLYVLEIEQSKLAVYMVGARFILNAWKLKKLTQFERSSSFPFVAWRNVKGSSQTLEEFEELDRHEFVCMRNLFLCLLPLILGFGGYRLMYQEFRSWYSWIILTLAVASQTAGFVIMTPQLFMNYRLKSVDHLPWRALSYQAVNTFIDDIFTLCIRMPEVQKYSVFRDDIVFIICCYQRWIYSGRRTVAVADEASGDTPDKKTN